LNREGRGNMEGRRNMEGRGIREFEKNRKDGR
jgi:hypothetical protein